MPRSVWFEVVDIQGNKILESHVDELSDKTSIAEFRDVLRARFSDDLPANLSPMEIAFFENRVAYDAKLPLACNSLLGDLGQNDANALIVQMPGVGNACWDFWMAILWSFALIVTITVGTILFARGQLCFSNGGGEAISLAHIMESRVQEKKPRQENMKKIESRESLESLESISIAESDGSIDSIDEFYEMV